MVKSGWNKHAQVTIFIIIAIIIVAAVAAYFILRSSISVPIVPASLEPVYASFLSCIKEDTSVGISVLESQGGYIQLPEFESGSGYMPFSSQLGFLGNPIPYWYYVSGNNVQKEQVPSISDMEDDLANYIEGKITGCLLDSYLENGYGVSMGEPRASVQINPESVEVNLNMNLALERANDSVVVSKHNVVVNSKLGELYSDARAIYDYEQSSLFLENYAVDTLRLYAPVDGVEMSCSPLVWNANNVFDELELAIEANTLALKVKNGDFSLTDSRNKYFILDIPGIKNNVLFLNSRNWSHSFEVNPSDSSVMMAKPIGNQPGMGIIGFCYVPYHFVYNVNYPVLVQVYSGEEIFNFPFAVVIQGNKPRQALNTSAVGTPEIDLCDYKNTLFEVTTYDFMLNPVSANISYKCFGEICDIGTTYKSNGSLIALFPQCANGFILAKSNGYVDTKYEVSTVNSGFADIFMDKLYKKTVSLSLDGQVYNGEAIINIVSDEVSETLVYPRQRDVKLSEGQYEVQVYIYRNASIQLQETTQEQCIEVPKEGIGAIFGITEEKCFDVVIPSQIISNSLVGGGKQNYYIAESELQTGTIIDINSDSLATPRTIEDLQKNYIEFEEKGLDIYFK